MREKQDLRVIKTHKVIRQALIDLLAEYEFDKISVEQILQTALVNRNTFYKYYSGKSDLAGALIGEFKQDYDALLNTKQQSLNLTEFFQTAMPFLFERRQLILALWKIKTRRHHLYDDMFLMLKNHYIQTQKIHFPTHDLDYQGETYATIVLSTMHYYFSQNLPIDIKKVWREIGEIMKVM